MCLVYLLYKYHNFFFQKRNSTHMRQFYASASKLDGQTAGTTDNLKT